MVAKQTASISAKGTEAYEYTGALPIQSWEPTGQKNNTKRPKAKPQLWVSPYPETTFAFLSMVT